MPSFITSTLCHGYVECHRGGQSVLYLSSSVRSTRDCIQAYVQVAGYRVFWSYCQVIRVLPLVSDLRLDLVFSENVYTFHFILLDGVWFLKGCCWGQLGCAHALLIWRAPPSGRHDDNLFEELK